MLIKRGSVLHSERPFVFVLSSAVREARCDYCFMPYELFTCGSCHYVKYCDRKCQKSAWPDHKSECVPLKDLLHKSRVIPNSARMLARIIWKLKRGGGGEKGWYDKNKFRMFKDLMSHYSDMKVDQKRSEHALTLHVVLRDFMGDEELPNFTEFLGIYGRMVVNSFNILDGEMAELGTGIYLGASTIDHSCEPNAVATFVNTTIHIRAIKDIPDYKWSKVRISYIETLKPRAERNEELAPRYYFECDCIRCDLSQEICQVEESLYCSQCSAAILLAQEGLRCSRCQWKLPDDFISTYHDIVSFTKHQHELMKDVAYLDACRICLEKQKGLFHHDNIHYVRTLDLAFEASIQLSKWGDSLELGPKLIRGYEKYYGLHHPILGLHYLKYGKILLLMDSIKEAVDALEKAQAILRVTHGEDHPLFRTELASLMLQAKSSQYENTDDNS